MAKPDGVRARILELLADGQERLASQIAAEVHEQWGFSPVTVIVEVSRLAFHRNVARRHCDAYRQPYVYRRTDVGATAA